MVGVGSAGGSDEWKREGGDGWKGRKDGVVRERRGGAERRGGEGEGDE
jgi:hypothetical protein